MQIWVMLLSRNHSIMSFIRYLDIPKEMISGTFLILANLDDEKLLKILNSPSGWHAFKEKASCFILTTDN